MDRHPSATPGKVKLVCHHCGARYLIPVAKIRGRRFRANCKRCDEEIVARYRAGQFEVLSGKASDIERSAGVEPDASWYVAVGGEPLGPITTKEVEGYVYSGEVNADTYAWCEGMVEWQPIAELRALRHLVLEQPRGIDRSVDDPPTSYFARDEAPRVAIGESDPSVPTRIAERESADVALADTHYAPSDGFDVPAPASAVAVRRTGALPDSFSEPGVSRPEQGPSTRPIERVRESLFGTSSPQGWPDDDQEPQNLQAVDEFEDEATRLVRQRVDDLPDRRELTGRVRLPDDWSREIDLRWGERPGKVGRKQVHDISSIELKKKVEVSEVRLWTAARRPVTLPPPSTTMGDSPLRHLTSKGLPPPPTRPPPPLPPPSAAPPVPSIPQVAAMAPPAGGAGPSVPPPVLAIPPAAPAPLADPLIPSLGRPSGREPEEQVSDILPSLVPQLPPASPVAPPAVPSNLLVPKRSLWTPLTVSLVALLGVSVVAGATVAVVLLTRRPPPPPGTQEPKVAVATAPVPKKSEPAPPSSPKAVGPSAPVTSGPTQAHKEIAPATSPPTKAKAAAPKASPAKKLTAQRTKKVSRKKRPSARRRAQRAAPPKRGSAAVDDVLAAARPAPKARRVASGNAADDVLAAGMTSASPGAMPRKPSRAALSRAMNQIKPRVRGCFERFRQAGTLKLRLTVRGSGTATGRTIGSFASTPTAACVERGISSMRFPRFSGSAVTFVYPFNLQ